jgi:Flp pilus assembly protein TadG
MRRPRSIMLCGWKNQDGVTIVLIAVLLVVFVAFTALAVDISHLYAVRNELQNAADAGALAATQVLYCPPACSPTCNPSTCPSMGAAVNQAANDMGGNVAIANKSENVIVEATWNAAANSGDVQRGHWSMSARDFTADPSLAAIPIANYTTAELDSNRDADTGADLHYINAVQVMVRRQVSPANSFFARILGFNSFALSARAVAYVAYAASLEPYTVKGGPIVICRQSIVDVNGNLTCTIGRMINSGNTAGTHNTAGWSDLDQTSCGNPKQSDMLAMVCVGNDQPLEFGKGVSANGGQKQPVYDALGNCWRNNADTNGDGRPDVPWAMTLPVVDCGDSNNVNGCPTVVGAVSVNVIWMTDILSPGNGSDPHFNYIPRSMANPITGTTWTCADDSTEAKRKACWNSFVAAFHLKNVDDVGVTEADYAQKSIYFLPDCTVNTPIGSTGGANYGIQSWHPVLVN